MRKVVIDSNSLINIIKYYSKLKKFDKLKDLLNNKIKNGEIIVLDKVVSELNGYRGQNNALVQYTGITTGLNTIFLLTDFHKTQNWYLQQNEMRFRNPNHIQREKDEFQNTHADLFLVLYCLHLKNQNEDVVLVTDESFGRDGKLYKKIPQICNEEGIDFLHSSDFILDELKNEIEIGIIE